MELNQINEAIKTLAKSEKITKAVLGSVSRDMLVYVVEDESYDSDAINRLLAVLTPMNKRTAILFFSHFTPFIVDDKGIFGGMAKNKKAKAKAKLESSKACTEFLADEDNNIWKWAEDNIKIEQKDVDWGKRITSAVTSGMDDEKGGLDLAEVMEAVLAAGVDASAISEALAILYAEEAANDQVAA